MSNIKTVINYSVLGASTFAAGVIANTLLKSKKETEPILPDISKVGEPPLPTNAHLVINSDLDYSTERNQPYITNYYVLVPNSFALQIPFPLTKSAMQIATLQDINNAAITHTLDLIESSLLLKLIYTNMVGVVESYNIQYTGNLLHAIQTDSTRLPQSQNRFLDTRVEQSGVVVLNRFRSTDSENNPFVLGSLNYNIISHPSLLGNILSAYLEASGATTSAPNRVSADYGLDTNHENGIVVVKNGEPLATLLTAGSVTSPDGQRLQIHTSQLQSQTVPLLGIDTITVPPSATYPYGGVRVSSITAASPASNAGVKAGDTIISVDDNPVFDNENFRRILRQYKPLELIKMVVRDRDRPLDSRVTLLAVPYTPPTLGRYIYNEKGDPRIKVQNRDVITRDHYRLLLAWLCSSYPIIKNAIDLLVRMDLRLKANDFSDYTCVFAPFVSNPTEDQERWIRNAIIIWLSLHKTEIPIKLLREDVYDSTLITPLPFNPVTREFEINLYQNIEQQAVYYTQPQGNVAQVAKVILVDTGRGLRISWDKTTITPIEI